MNTQEICGILEKVNPDIMGFGKKSADTDFLADIGYIELFMSDDNIHWFATLTKKGERFLNQNKILNISKKLVKTSEFDNYVE